MQTDIPAFEVRLFGPLHVRVHGEPLRPLRSRKGLWLLALLTLRPEREIKRDWLAMLLWPDSDEERAGRSLRQSLHDLRVALGPEAWRLVSPSRRTISLDLAGARVDVEDFDRLSKLEDADSLAEAADLYQGRLLEDCSEVWVADERDQWDQAYLQVIERLIAALSKDGPLDRLTTYLRRALVVDPYREDWQLALMKALWEGGDTAGALLSFQQYRNRLQRELSVEPGEAATSLYRQLRSGARRRSGKPPPLLRTRQRRAAPLLGAPLPKPLSEFIGRQQELNELPSILAQSRLLTIVGTGGVGKTRLAVEVAARLQQKFGDGCCFVSFASLATGDLVAETLRLALGISQKANKTALEIVQEELRERHVLLLMDNCEHVVEDAARLADDLLRNCGDLIILATSRQPLGLWGETVWRLSGLEIGSETMEADAVALFRERAKASSPRLELSGKSMARVIEICQNLDGIPLAIELAAAKVRTHSIDDIATRIGEAPVFLGGSSFLEPRHETLDAAFQWSWDLLDEKEHHVLASLSVFAGGFTLEAANHVCSGGALEDCSSLVASLVEKSLVELSSQPVLESPDPDEPSRVRYYLLEPVRQFASVQLRKRGEEDGAQDRHLQFFWKWADRQRWTLWREHQGYWFLRFEDEIDNFRAALAWSRKSGDKLAETGLAVALGRFWDNHGHLAEGRAEMRRVAGQLDDEIPAALRARVHSFLGWQSYVQNDCEEALNYYGSALAIYRELEDHTSVAVTQNLLGCVHRMREDYSRAKPCFEAAIDFLRSAGSSRVLERRSREAEIPERSLVYCEPLRILAGRIFSNLAVTHMYLGDFHRAEELLIESLAAAKYEFDAQQPAISLGNLARVSIKKNQLNAAKEQCIDSLIQFVKLGSKVEVPPAILLLAIIDGLDGVAENFAVLWGASTKLHEEFAVVPERILESESQIAFAQSRQILGDERFEELVERGRSMTIDEATSYALARGPK